MNNATHNSVDCLPSLEALAENLDTGDEGRQRPFDKLLNNPSDHDNERPRPNDDASSAPGKRVPALLSRDGAPFVPIAQPQFYLTNRAGSCRTPPGKDRQQLSRAT